MRCLVVVQAHGAQLARSLGRRVLVLADLACLAVADGVLDGFACYFVAGFDDDITFTNAPDARPTNWRTPFLRVSPREIREGDVIELDLRCQDLADPKTWRW